MKEDVSTYRTYRRLLRYTRPYRVRLALGILTGMIAGGSIFGALRFVGPMIKPFERAVSPQEVVDDEAGPEEEPGVIENVVDSAATALGIEKARDDGTITWQFMLLSILGLPLFMGLRALMTYLNRYYMRWVGSRVVVDVRSKLFANLQNQSLKFFGKCNVGNLISRCTNDAALVERAVSSTVADLTRAPVEILVAGLFIVLSAIEHGMLGVLTGVLIVVPLVVLPIIVLGRRVKRHTRNALQRISDLVSRMQENFTGIRVVKAFHTEAREQQRFDDMNRRYFRDIIRALRAELLMQPMMEALGVVLACLALVFCYARGINLYEVMPLGVALLLAYRPLKQVVRINVSLQRSAAAAERLFEILDTDTSLPEAASPVAVDDFADAIRFENVSFRYAHEEPQVLHDINFELGRGEVAAFVGETGAGKTTVANLLARFYDPTAGRVTLDGIDLRDVKVESLRRLVGVVTQETILFNQSVADNIAYGSPDATRDDVVAAAEQANAHEFITGNPEGYDRVVGEKGFVLSGGQRQRIAIARAILRNPPILILDEATSALDTVTERLVQQALFRLMENRTVFAIAHRLSTIKHADQIYVLEGGTIAERGTHSELYEANGLYRHLCDIQFD